MLREKRKNGFFRGARLVFAILALILASSALYVTVIRPHFTRAAAQYMSALVTGDNDTQADFTPGINDATFNMSYIKYSSTSADSQIYSAKVSLRELPAGDKRLVIHLPAGVSWVDDGANDNHLRSQLDTSRGTNGVEKVALDHAKILGYAFPNSGDRVYYLSDGASDLTVSFKIKADSVVGLTHIDKAIEASLYFDNNLVENAYVATEIDGAASMPGKFYNNGSTLYVAKGATYQSNLGYYRLVYSNLVKGYNSVKRLIKQVKITAQLDNPAATMILQGADTSWSIDDSDAANGNYVFTETFSAINSGDFYFPYAVVIPEDAPDDTIYSIKMSAETTYYNEDGTEKTIVFSNSPTFKFRVLPSTGDVSIGWNNLSASNAGTAHDVSFAATAYVAEDSQGPLGYTYVNNRGGSDSAPKRLKMTFDTSVLGVMAIDASCVPNSRITTIHVKSASGVDKNVEVNKTCNSYGYAGAITFKDLGLEYGDYISEISYDFGVIPAATQIMRDSVGTEALGYLGKMLSDGPGVATAELYDIDDPSNTTGVAKITTRRTDGGGTLDITNLGTQVINAGQSLKFSINVTNWAGTLRYNNSVLSPVLYIRQSVKNANGEFLPISNLRITNGSARGNEDITSLFGQITYTDTETARVYKIDGRNVPDGRASLNSTYVNENGQYYNNIGINVSWTVDTDLTTPDQQFLIADMFFAQDPNRTGAITTHFRRGDPFGISGNANNTISAATNTYYQVRGWASIGVENSGKHTTSDGWLTWAEGSAPITIGSADGSLADMKISLSNNSGVDVPGPTIVYLPIPKKGENWGDLSRDGADFEFSTALADNLSNPDSEHFTIAYGKNVTPGDEGLALDAQADKFTTDTAGWADDDWAEVNCVKVVAMNVPANRPGTPDLYDFIYRLKVIDATNADDGAMNTWRPLYYQRLTNSAGDIFAGWYKGSYVSVKLADGKISGKLFIDANENGKLDNGEQDLKEEGWNIDLFDSTSNRIARSTTTDENGKYNFIELTLAENGYYAIVTNKHPISATGQSYLFAPKTTTATDYTADNYAEGDRDSNPAHATARISGITASHDLSEASYNIGLVPYVETDNYSGTVTFVDSNNRFNTRPANIAMTFTADADNVQTPSFATSSSSFSYDLPRYDRGSRLEYDLTIPDIDHYEKQLTVGDDHSFEITYTLKSAKLTVNHYKAGTTERLAESTTKTMSFTQQYNTQAADLGDDYEVTQIDGATSGTITGDVTVNYYYRLNRGTVVTHYYLKDSTDQIFDDTSEEYDYGTKYETTPITTMPSGYQNYGPASTTPENYKGELHAPLVEVVYYYEPKTVSLGSEIELIAPDTIYSPSAQVPYEIKYKAEVKDYVGPAEITITNELPYDIDEKQSDLDGGSYDPKTRTITWTETIDHDSYLDGETIEISHNISLVYKNAVEGKMTSAVQGDITLRADQDSVSGKAQSIIRIPEESGAEESPIDALNPFTNDSLLSIVALGLVSAVATIAVLRLARRRA